MIPISVLEIIIIVLLGTLIGTNVGLHDKLKKDHKADMRVVNTEMKEFSTYCARTTERMAKIETKMDIYLAHVGFDLMKVNRTIREHLEDLETQDTPAVGGCINISGLYKD